MVYLVVFALFLGVAHAGMVKRAAGDQSPKVWDALAVLRGKELTTAQINDLYLTAIPGQDFPIIAELPAQANIDCGAVKPGFYADTDAGRCQIFNRCDINGNLTSYLCPNMTLFNQITLVCDWWYNVDCSHSKQFVDYSNSRLYQEGVPLLDDQDEVAVAKSTGAVSSKGKSTSSKKSKGRSGGKKRQNA